ncbi:protein CURVATURE THYLAKOID 1B, chloroplastic [Punica granatum]|uniref:Protein CURVATURE THYLAKOID 1B, chloroplastic n=1 Tax=Punica granatum TaxID=22663 RepID=A0A6P8CZB6_PUNGR|nr:protein CURVATURE THYLAKOID 1B, chloroplastic [Punica granatum]
MASTTTSSSALSLSSSSTLVDGKPPLHLQPPSQCVSLPPFPSSQQVHQQHRSTWKSTAYCAPPAAPPFTPPASASFFFSIHYSRSVAMYIDHFVLLFSLPGGKIARNVMALATGEAPAEVAATELPVIFKTVKEAWDNVEDKYAVTSLGVAGAVALWGSTGMISAIDRLPLIPGVLELVGIGYTGWFAYKNLIFKPDREALLRKIKDTYRDIIGSS